MIRNASRPISLCGSAQGSRSAGTVTWQFQSILAAITHPVGEFRTINYTGDGFLKQIFPADFIGGDGALRNRFSALELGP
jgi:hypothetical protein